MTKKEHARKKYGLLPPKIAESDTLSLTHGLCVSDGSIYNKDTSQNTLSACTHNDRSSNTSLVGLKLSKPQISQQHPSRICFITPGWHVTRNLNLLSLTMRVWENSNVSSNKCVTIMALKPNQLQVTTYHPQANAIIERIHKVVNDMLRSFYLQNNHENLEEQEDNPFVYFLQSTAWLSGY
jgi:hypothetical protein